ANYLGARIQQRFISPQKVVIEDPKIHTLNDIQKLVGAIQWLRQFALFSPEEMKPFTDELAGTQDLAAPWEL
ncbi:POK6 protein, partial [Lophotis ruficrista]|nr:POK6 protein [Lophotis ruficrista]